MAASDSGTTILKILTGVQAGVDVALIEGDYTLGSGDDDDIQIFDVSLKAGHARLAVRPGVIRLAGGTGGLRTRNGLALEPGGEFGEIEQLDVVSAGTTRFALGARTANWASIAEEEGGEAARSEGARRPAAPAAGLALPWWRTWQAALPVAAVLALVAGTAMTMPLLDGGRATSAEGIARDEVASLRAAVDAFPFGRSLGVEQEVDGALFVTGLVETPVERRAILGAVRELDLPARVRVGVRELIRSEVANLVEAEGYKISFDLSDAGALTLKGVILDPKKADDLVALVRERVSGPSTVASEIRTSQTLLGEATALAERSQIRPLVILRLDGPELIEASGIIPTAKIDAWVGFLQSYSSQYAGTIPLRSLVRLQNPDGTIGEPGAGAGEGLYLGGGEAAPGDSTVDVDRLRSGAFDMADIFVGQEPKPAPGEETASAGAGDGAPEGVEADNGGGGRVDLSDLLPGEAAPDVPAPVRTVAAASQEPSTRRVGDASLWTPVAQPPGPGIAPVAGEANGGEPLGDMGRELLRRWSSGSLDDSAAGRKLEAGMNALDRHDPAAPDAIRSRYAPLLARVRADVSARERCWPDSELTRGTVAGALFWLDLFSVSDSVSIADLGAREQNLVLEAALNPRRTADCAADAAGEAFRSVYLDEVRRNSGFVDFVTRDLDAFPLDIAGVNLSGERYVQTRAGRKLREGAAPDGTSRIALVGELGVAVQRSDGYSTDIFGTDLNWFVR